MAIPSWKILAIGGGLILILGIFLASINTIVLDFVLRDNMVLSPTSSSYPMWKDLPVPLIATMYLFNLTNAADVQEKGAKPNLKEVGPYSFREYHHKTDEVWNDNGTVTYKQVKRWKHISGNIDELVTIVNVPYATLGAIAEQQSPIVRSLINMGIATLQEKLFVTKTAREILFDGYSDPMLEAAVILEKLNIKMPGLMDKFGFYYGRNNTEYSDGIANIYTGYNGLGELGRVNSLNYSSQSPFFEGSCGKVMGSADLFPPYMEHQGDKQYVFNNDLCRTLELTVSNMSVNVNGVQGIEYKVDELFLANSTTNPKNSCFDKGNQSLPNGVFNASACRFGAPIYMSQPHFYQADPYYASLLAKGSVQPNKTAHETVFIFEPVSGVAMKVLARFQVNIKMDKIKELSAFKKLGGTFFLPTIWFETAMVLPQQLTDKMWYLSNLRLFMMIAAGVLMAIGIVMFMYGAFHYCSAVRAEYAEMDSEEPTADTTGTAKAENESDEANESLDRSHTDAE